MTERLIANIDMAAAWDGEEGAGWAARAEYYDKSGTRYNPHLLDRISADGDVLDVGCGNGDRLERPRVRRAPFSASIFPPRCSPTHAGALRWRG